MEQKQIANESHCFFCENRKLDLQQGLICSITESKREIRRKCPDFEFRKDKRIVLRDFNEELEKPEHQKANIIGVLVKWLVVGGAMVTGGVILFNMALDAYVVHLLPIGMVLAGFITMPFGIGAYLKGMQSLKALREKHEEYMYILNLYERRR
ncbi:MAG: hypothetical protein CL840_02225 [Crocinitomicaceae bacterium]|nr:hypothetical protein [Crocinitomicaceae bacterium]|tara:strand:- start:4114 stop:4572 length:459 start_codon:yes stop_codon:yes gene_type:complete